MFCRMYPATRYCYIMSHCSTFNRTRTRPQCKSASLYSAFNPTKWTIPAFATYDNIPRSIIWIFNSHSHSCESTKRNDILFQSHILHTLQYIHIFEMHYAKLEIAFLDDFPFTGTSGAWLLTLPSLANSALNTTTLSGDYLNTISGARGNGHHW